MIASEPMAKELRIDPSAPISTALGVVLARNISATSRSVWRSTNLSPYGSTIAWLFSLLPRLTITGVNSLSNFRSQVAMSVRRARHGLQFGSEKTIKTDFRPLSKELRARCSPERSEEHTSELQSQSNLV